MIFIMKKSLSDVVTIIFSTILAFILVIDVIKILNLLFSQKITLFTEINGWDYLLPNHTIIQLLLDVLIISFSLIYSLRLYLHFQNNAFPLPKNEISEMGTKIAIIIGTLFFLLYFFERVLPGKYLVK